QRQAGQAEERKVPGPDRVGSWTRPLFSHPSQGRSSLFVPIPAILCDYSSPGPSLSSRKPTRRRCAFYHFSSFLAHESRIPDGPALLSQHAVLENPLRDSP